jgi:putative N6-adenine-specific DNA methylase
MPAHFELIAPCFFGCEATASFELKRIGAENVRVTDGRLTFSGGADIIAAANLNLRAAERVLVLLKTYEASTFDELFDGVYAIPWEEFLPADGAFPVKGSSLNSQLTSVPACQSIIKKAIVKRLMQYHHTSTLPESGAEYRVQFLLRKNVCEVMLDTTGDALHKRGYRRNAMEAPIRETLAAAMVDLGRVRRDSQVQDPFCGSGTLIIEAAQKAMNIAPGLKRRFAAERYSFVPAQVWAEQRQKALGESRLDAAFEGFGYDIDPAAVAQANANAKLAGVETRCHFEVADVADFAARPEAIVLTNPPYGERMSTIEGAARLAHTLGERMAAHPCAGVYAITADMEFEAHYGRRATKRRKMYNGMIPCQIYMYYDAPHAAKGAQGEAKIAKPMPAKGFDGRRATKPDSAFAPKTRVWKGDK